MKDFRVLWLTENYSPRRGGMAQACDRIVSNLRRSGLEIDVAFFSPGCKKNRFVQQQGGRLILVTATESAGHDLNCFYNLITSEEQQKKYTHIVAFGGHYPILAAPVLKAWLQTRTIIMLRGNDFDLGVFQPQKRMLLSDAITSADRVCLLSQDQMTKARSLFPKVRFVHIPNGIDNHEWQAEETEARMADEFKRSLNADNRLIIGLIGQLKAKKGAAFFLQCVLKAGLHDKLHFLLIGDLEDQMQQWLEEHSQELSFTSLPFLDRFELLSRYPACDFVALPSHYDGMPNVLLEAGALNIPAIAARSGGITEVVPDDLRFLTFHPGSESQCQRALCHAVDLSTQQRQNAGKILAEHIRQNFSCNQETLAYKKLFSSIKPFKTGR